MNLHEFEAYARATIPVPTGYLFATQSLNKASATAQPNIRWDISHFPPENVSICTIGQGQTPEAALAHLITQLTPCEPSAPSESSATPSPSTSGMQSPPVPSDMDTATTAPAVG